VRLAVLDAEAVAVAVAAMGALWEFPIARAALHLDPRISVFHGARIVTPWRCHA
jgi:hypothetical protein